MLNNSYINISHDKEKTVLTLKGFWRIINIQDIQKTLQNLSLSSQQKIIFDLSQLEAIDTGTAYFFKAFILKLQKKKMNIEILKGNKAVMSILHLIKENSLSNSFPDQSKSQNFQTKFFNFLAYSGQISVQYCQTLLLALSFLGEVFCKLVKVIINPQRLRWISLINLMYKVGVSALPIVGLISALIGVVLVYQGADQLKRFGAEIFTVDLLAVSVLRELGILLTAIVIAGRSGSSYTAQLGFMKLNQEIDALTVLGLDPVEILVLPRILALTLMLPLLTFYSDMMALIGGGITTHLLLGIGFEDFSHHVLLSVKKWTFWIGIIKAPIFAFFIAFISCFEGLRVSGGAESVGRHTTQSVVESIFLVIVLDAMFSIMFSLLRI